MVLHFIVSSLVRTDFARIDAKKEADPDSPTSQNHAHPPDSVWKKQKKQRMETGGRKARRKKCPPFLSWEGQIAADGVKDGHYLWVSRAELLKFVCPWVWMCVCQGHLSPACSPLAFSCPLMSLYTQRAAESHQWSDMLTGVCRFLRSTHKHGSQGKTEVWVGWLWLTEKCTEGTTLNSHNAPVQSTYAIQVLIWMFMMCWSIT